MTLALLVALLLALVVAGGALWHAREQAERADASRSNNGHYVEQWMQSEDRNRALTEQLADAERRARRRARRNAPDTADASSSLPSNFAPESEP